MQQKSIVLSCILLLLILCSCASTGSTSASSGGTAAGGYSTVRLFSPSYSLAPRDDSRSKQRVDPKLISSSPEVIEAFSALQSDDPAITGFQNAAMAALESGRFEQTELLLNEASEKERVSLRRQDKHLLSAAAMKAANGALKFAQGDYDRATIYYKDAAGLVPGGSDAIRAKYLNQWGIASLEKGNGAEALEAFDKALAILQTQDPKWPEVARVYVSVAEVSILLGNLDLAEKQLLRSKDIQVKSLEPDHLDLARTDAALGRVLRMKGRYQDAATSLESAIRVWKRRLGKDNAYVAKGLLSLAAVKYLSQASCSLEAKQLYTEGLDVAMKVHGHEHPLVANYLVDRGNCSASEGRYAEAERYYKDGLQIYEKLGGDNSGTTFARCKLAEVYTAERRFREAQSLFTQNMKRIEGSAAESNAYVTKACSAIYAAFLRNIGLSVEAQKLENTH